MSNSTRRIRENVLESPATRLVYGCGEFPVIREKEPGAPPFKQKRPGTGQKTHEANCNPRFDCIVNAFGDRRVRRSTEHLGNLEAKEK
jgi:hypothetical protein